MIDDYTDPGVYEPASGQPIGAARGTVIIIPHHVVTRKTGTTSTWSPHIMVREPTRVRTSYTRYSEIPVSKVSNTTGESSRSLTGSRHSCMTNRPSHCGAAN